MRGKSLKMHHIREVLRLAATGTSNRMISGCLGIARSTVADVLGRAAEAGLAWPLAPEMGDAELAQALYQRPARSPHLGARRHAEPDWAAIHLELKRPHVTLALLYSFGAHGIMTLNDFKALEGDKLHGVRSLPVTLGPDVAARVACTVMSSAAGAPQSW